MPEQIVDSFRQDGLDTDLWKTARGTFTVTESVGLVPNVPSLSSSVLAANAGTADGEISALLSRRASSDNANENNGLIFRESADLLTGWSVTPAGLVKFDPSQDVNDTAGVRIDLQTTFSQGDLIRVILRGPTIRVFRNDTWLAEITSPTNEDATWHGFNGFGDDASQVAWRDFRFTPAVVRLYPRGDGLGTSSAPRRIPRPTSHTGRIIGGPP